MPREVPENINLTGAMRLLLSIKSYTWNTLQTKQTILTVLVLD